MHELVYIHHKFPSARFFVKIQNGANFIGDDVMPDAADNQFRVSDLCLSIEADDAYVPTPDSTVM